MRDAHEEGGDTTLNVFDAVEVTEIKSPGAAWATVNEAAATALHEHRQAWQTVPSMREAVTVLMSRAGDVEVGERLGLVPGDPGAADASSDPEPIPYAGDPDNPAVLSAAPNRSLTSGSVEGDEVFEESGDTAPTESTGSAPASGRKK